MSHTSFRHIATLLLLTGVFLLWRPAAVFAATGTFKQINFQGKVVTKTTGVNVADGSYTFVFSLYTVSSAGTNIWTESKSVTVTNGIFQTLLGDTTALPGSVDFNTDNLYLGINFNGDGEMSPRVRFTAVPQAFNALKVAGLTVTDTTGTLTIPNGTTIAFSGANDVTFTTSGSTGITLPTTGTLATLAGAESLTNKTIGATGLVFSGAATDITTTSGEALTLSPGGTGQLVLNSANTSASAVDINATGTVAGAAITMDTTDGGITLTAAGASNGDIALAATDDININGTAGSLVNIGTSAVTQTITIGAASNTDVVIQDANWGVNSSGVLTVASCTGCGGGASTLQGAYDGSSGNTITTTTARDLAIVLGEVVTPTSFTLENQDTAGTTAFGLTNSIASGTLTNGILITQSGAGTMTSALKITESAGAITDGIVVSGTLGNILNTDSIDISGAGAISGATGVSTTTVTASSTIAANGGITFDASTDTVGAFTLAGTLDANSNIITNLGATTTDFTTSGSLAIGLDAADANGALMVDNVAQASPILVAKDNGTMVWQIADNGLQTFDPATTGTIASFALATQWTSGTVLGAAFGGATTQAAAITGASFDFSTNLTVPDSASGNQTGLSLTMKNGGASATANGVVIDGTMDTGITIGSGTNAITNGIVFGSTGITTDLTLQNNEKIDNNSPGIINFALANSGSLKLTDASSNSFNISPISGDGGQLSGATYYYIKDENNSNVIFEFDALQAANTAATFMGQLNFLTSANTSGTNVNEGLKITTTIANSTGGTNTLNIVGIDAVAGDAQVTTNAINIGAMTGTGATETAIKIASGWDTDISGASWNITSAGVLTVTSCTGCGGGASSLQGAYDGDADGGNATLLMNATDGSVIFNNAAGTQFKIGMATTTAPTVDMMNLTNTGASQATVTTAVDGLQVDFAIGATASVIDNAGLRINMTSAAAGATSTLSGLNIGSLTSANASVTEYALRIDGASWDRAISAGGTIAFTTLASCDTIDTDANGVLSCGTDSGAGAGAANLQEAYDGDANGSDAIITMTSTDGSIIFQTVAGTQFQIAATAAPTVDLQMITNTGFGTVTDAVDGLAINFTQGDDADATDTNMGIHITLTSSSGDADTLIGLDVNNVTGGSATEKGIRIGSGFDQDLEFVDTTPVIRMPDAGSLKFQDDQGNTLAALTEYFSGTNYGVFEAGGFINTDGSYYQDQFLAPLAQGTADIILYSVKYGDKHDWVFDEAGTYSIGVGSNAAGSWGCAVNQNSIGLGNINGYLELTPELTTSTAGVRGAACRMTMASQTGASTVGILNVANKWVMYWKVKPTSNWTNNKSNRAMYFGANNFSMAWAGTIPYGTSANPAQGAGAIHMFNGDPTNNNPGSNWRGIVVSGTLANQTGIPCGVSVVTSAFALLRIEARATNDVGFYVDPDISNGISFTNCGSATVNVPSVNLAPSLNVGNSLATGQVGWGSWSAQVDLFAFVQDDPRDFSGGASVVQSAPSEVVAPPAPNPINGADLAENYYFEHAPDLGDIVVYGAKPGDATTSAKGFDRKILGVISESPGLTMGEAHESSAPVAITGRVPTKVNSTGGKIEIGDPITTSEQPGFGMRAKTPGKIVGTAMENFACVDTAPCEGKIMVNVNVGYYLGDESDTALLVQKEVASIGATLSEPELTALTATASGSLGVSHDLTAGLFSKFMDLTGGIRVSTMFESIGTAIFKGPSDFLAKVMFKDKVGFENQVTFNNDSAGNAIIKEGQRFVDVSFEKEYDNEPIVSANLSIPRVTADKMPYYLDKQICLIADTVEACQDKVSNLTLAVDVRYAVVSKSKQGFMILLSKETPTDLLFSWSAVAIKDAKTSTNSRPGVSTGSALLSPLSTVSPTAAPTTSPLPLLSPLPSIVPTMTPVPSPAATNSAILTP